MADFDRRMLFVWSNAGICVTTHDVRVIWASETPPAYCHTNVSVKPYSLVSPVILVSCLLSPLSLLFSPVTRILPCYLLLLLLHHTESMKLVNWRSGVLGSDATAVLLPPPIQANPSVKTAAGTETQQETPSDIDGRDLWLSVQTYSSYS